MTTYIIGAFEALFWAWRMLRDKDTEEGREEIQIILARLGKSEHIDFEELRLKMGETFPLWENEEKQEALEAEGDAEARARYEATVRYLIDDEKKGARIPLLDVMK